MNKNQPCIFIHFSIATINSLVKIKHGKYTTIPCNGEIQKKRSRRDVAKHILKRRGSSRTSRGGSSVLASIIGSTITITITMAVITSICIVIVRARAPEIIIGALAIVDEDLVGLGDLLESEGGALPHGLGGVGVLVWVQLHRQFPERFLDFFFARTPWQPQNFVVVHWFWNLMIFNRCFACDCLIFCWHGHGIGVKE